MQQQSSSSQPGEYESNASEREKFGRVSEDMRSRAEEMAGDVSHRARAYYDDASQWLQQNYGRTLAVVGVLAAVGLVGFWMAKGSRENRLGRESRY